MILLDTNIVMSGLGAKNRQSPTRLILDAVKAGRFQILLSPALIEEYQDVLNRPESTRWHGLQPPLPERFILELINIAVVVDPPFPQSLPGDPDDAHLWALLEAVPDSVLITGDKRLLESTDFPGRVLTAREWVNRQV
jgi:putative PIN family toxin of toxin-antitoxin system